MSTTRKSHYKIKKGIELPNAGKSYGAFCPVKDMEPGDSFTFALADEARVRSLVDNYGKKNGCAFYINIAEEGTCWRI